MTKAMASESLFLHHSQVKSACTHTPDSPASQGLAAQHADMALSVIAAGWHTSPDPFSPFAHHFNGGMKGTPFHVTRMAAEKEEVPAANRRVKPMPPSWMVDRLDSEAGNLAVSRNALITSDYPSASGTRSSLAKRFTEAGTLLFAHMPVLRRRHPGLIAKTSVEIRGIAVSAFLALRILACRACLNPG
jgi:hypothetical protein